MGPWDQATHQPDAEGHKEVLLWPFSLQTPPMISVWEMASLKTPEIFYSPGSIHNPHISSHSHLTMASCLRPRARIQSPRAPNSPPALLQPNWLVNNALIAHTM